MEDEIKTKHVDDGVDDVIIVVNGHKLVIMPAAGYKNIGLTFEDAKSFATNLSTLLVAANRVINGTEKPQ